MNDRSTRTGGEWIVDALRVEGVRHVFGIPGVHNLAIYDALIRQSEITHVLARHEAGAAFMADGYARASGAPGVVVVTTGPGATNALTPLVESYAGSVPVLVVMSDVASPLVGRISMDQSVLDVTEIPGVQAGDEVVILGSQGGQTISAYDHADAAGSIPWEVFTRIGARVARIAV